MRICVSLLLILGLWQTALADNDRAGTFDYYVLSLSWSPTWCALEGDDRRAPQCADDKDFGWVLHGLWPQYEQGWPSHCRSSFAPPSRVMTRNMADIMGSSGLAWYQWKKHGSCSGLSPADYYTVARRAFESVKLPEVFQKLNKPVQLPASVIEDAFIADNPILSRDMLTITCKSGRIQEARLCLTRDFEPRKCGIDVIQDCSKQDALFDPIR